MNHCWSSSPWLSIIETNPLNHNWSDFAILSGLTLNQFQKNLLLRGCVATSTRLQWNCKGPVLRVWIVFAFTSRFQECWNFDAFYLKSSDRSSFKKNHTGPNSSFSMFLVFSDWNFADESEIHVALYFLECPVHYCTWGWDQGMIYNWSA